MCTRVQDLNKADWGKLVRMMRYLLNGTTKLQLILSAGNLNCIKWYMDASFAVHPDFKSHTGAAMHLEDGTGAVQSISRKHKLGTQSSTESELVGADHVSVMILLTKYGQSCSWKHKVTRYARTSYTKITRVLFYWK